MVCLTSALHCPPSKTSCNATSKKRASQSDGWDCCVFLGGSALSVLCASLGICLGALFAGDLLRGNGEVRFSVVLVHVFSQVGQHRNLLVMANFARRR